MNPIEKEISIKLFGYALRKRIYQQLCKIGEFDSQNMFKKD